MKGFARVGLEKLASLTVLLNVQVLHQHLAGRADNISPPQGGSAGNQVDCFLNLVSGGGALLLLNRRASKRGPASLHVGALLPNKRRQFLGVGHPLKPIGRAGRPLLEGGCNLAMTLNNRLFSRRQGRVAVALDRKSTRLNSSHRL